VRAQTTGTVSGVATDQTGAAVPGVSVGLQSVDTGAVRTASTDASGNYVFPLLLPGPYKLTAQKAGFSKVEIKDVIVKVDSPTRVDVSLAVASQTQQLTVTANVVAVNTENATLGEVVGSTQIVSLPLNGRNFLQLSTLTAGAYTTAPSSDADALSGGRKNVSMSVSGTRESSSSFLFDGIESKHDYYGAVGVEPPVDSIAEFKIEQGYFSPEFGLPGVVNVVLKSGTDSFHGAAWEFLRNNVLDARNFFDNLTGAPVVPYRQNQFGGNLGGPIRKDKLFFFGDYEGLRIRQSFTAFDIVPTSQMLQGNFAGLPTILDPATYNPATGTKQPFPNNQIPSGRIVSFAQKFNQFIPAPNSAPVAALGGANLFGSSQSILSDNKFDVKVDFVKSTKDSIFARLSYLNSAGVTTSILPGAAEIGPLRTRNFVFSWTRVFTPTVVNSLRVGVNHTFLTSLAAEDYTGPDWGKLAGLQNTSTIVACNSVPAVNLAGVETFGFAPSNCKITGDMEKTFLDNLSVVHGRHNIMIGGTVTRFYQRTIGGNSQDGSFIFTGQYTGNSVADYLIGSPQTVSGSGLNQPWYYFSWRPDVYLNDDVHATRKLTLNLGLRWQYEQPFREKYNHIGRLDLSTGVIAYAGPNDPPLTMWKAHYADFAPRIGFAYAPRDNWAIRGSYGLFYDRLPGNEMDFGTNVPLYLGNYSATGGVAVSGIDMSTLFPTVLKTPQGSPGQYLTVITRSHDPMVQQWTLSLEHTLPGRIFTQLAYVGSRGEHESTRVDANADATPPAPGDTRTVQERRPLPYYSWILANESAGDSFYHSLQLNIRKEMGHGLTFLNAYTYASSVTTVGNWGNISYRWTHLDRGRNPDDPRHRWVTSLVYGLPFAKNSTGLARQIAAGWTINGILTLQTGYPFTATTSSDPSNTGTFFSLPANRSCNGNLPGSQRTRLHWFDTSCFALPPQNTFANGGINYLYTDGTRNVDFAILKDFPFWESRRLEFRAEFFNGFNNVNFGQPGSTVGTSTFGIVGSAGAARIIQFGLKFLF
jgi:hypothetical protein